jgi:hypothetical protein
MAVNDLFDGLFPCKFRDVSFPVTNITTEFSHDQVVHERPDKDGAKVEATGRKALQISATAVFYNFIVPGKKEEWQGPLYPGVYNRFIVAFADRRTCPPSPGRDPGQAGLLQVVAHGGHPRRRVGGGDVDRD